MLDAVASFWIRQGDTGRALVVLLKNMDGSDAVMPAGTTCQFTMVQRQTGHTVTAAAMLADGPNPGSNNQATIPTFDTTQPGLYDATWVVTYPDAGGTETFPTRGGGVGAWTVTTGYTVQVVPQTGDLGLSGS
jgi:hypothetical protein